MQRDLDAIRAFLQQMIVEKAQAAMVNTPIVVAGAPTRGAATAKVMMVEVSDYHCPFCRRHTLDDPAADRRRVHQHRQAALRLHRLPDRPAAPRRVQGARGGQLRRRAGQVLGDAREALRDAARRATAPSSCRSSSRRPRPIGLDVAKFRACFDGGKYAAPVKDNVARMQALGVDSTPTFLIGLTPAPGQPMKVSKW